MKIIQVLKGRQDFVNRYYQEALEVYSDVHDVFEWDEEEGYCDAPYYYVLEDTEEILKTILTCNFPHEI